MHRYFTFIILLLALSSCGVKFKNTSHKRNELPDAVLGDFKYTSANSMGQREWDIKATDAKMYNTKNEIELYNMAMTFYDAENNIQSFLSANFGFVNKATLQVYAEGNVKILSKQHAILSANKVFWNNDIKQFYTKEDELVTITRGNTVINGYNMKTDAELKEVVIEKVVADVVK